MSGGTDHLTISRRALLRMAAGSSLTGVAVTAVGTVPGRRWLRRAAAATGEPVLSAASYGAVGDGIVDDTVALQNAINDAAASAQTLVIPPGSYVVTKSLRAASGLTLSAYGATLLTKIAGLGNSGRNVPTVLINNASDVVIAGLAVDGRKRAFAHTEYKAGICVDNSSNVTLEDCDLYDCKGDGLIFNARFAGNRNVNAVVRNTTCRSNYRLGCAITELTSGRFHGCRFTGTSGTSPMAGVDVEPDFADAWIDDIQFHQCEFSGNGNQSGNDGAGISIHLHAAPAAPQGNVHFHDCIAAGNSIMGAILYHGHDVGFHNCDISGNGHAGITIARTSSNIVIEGGTIANNSRAWPRNYDGIALNGTIRNVRIEQNVIRSGHRYGLSVGPTVTDLVVTGNSFSGNALGDIYPASILNEPPATSTPTHTSTPAPTATTPPATATPASAATSTPTPTPSATAPWPSPTPSSTPTQSPPPTATATIAPSPTATATTTPTATSTPSPAPSATATASPTRTATPTPTASATATASPTATATPLPPTATPTPTARPAETPRPPDSSSKPAAVAGVPAPRMRGAKIKIAGATSSVTSSKSSYAYDGKTSSAWYTKKAQRSATLTFDLGGPAAVSSCRWMFSRNGYVDKVTIDVSVDGSRWTRLFESGPAPAKQWQGFVASATVRFVRVGVARSDAGRRLGFLAEFVVYGSPIVAEAAGPAEINATPAVAASSTSTPTAMATATATPQPTAPPTNTVLPESSSTPVDAPSVEIPVATEQTPEE